MDVEDRVCFVGASVVVPHDVGIVREGRQLLCGAYANPRKALQKGRRRRG